MVEADVEISDCVMWEGSINNYGYGKVRLNGRPVYAHRLAYCEANGCDIADIEGRLVRHKCDTPGCVNPAHLELGTPHDNNMDCIKRGRHVASLGENHGLSKLTKDQVVEIRTNYQKGVAGHGINQLAKKYGVGASTIYNVLKRNTWRHV